MQRVCMLTGQPMAATLEERTLRTRRSEQGGGRFGS
jgi:hypothetical protein